MSVIKLMTLVFFISVSTSSLAQEMAAPADRIKKAQDNSLSQEKVPAENIKKAQDESPGQEKVSAENIKKAQEKVSADRIKKVLNQATPADIIKKVHEAALFLSQAGDPGLKTFNDRNGAWVFKDTYVFVFNCDKGIIVAHPIKAKLVGRNLMGLKDVKGNYFFAQLCDASKKPGGGWVEYWWPKVNGMGSSRKISLLLQVPNSPYQVGAGIYDNSRSIKDLENLLN